MQYRELDRTGIEVGAQCPGATMLGAIGNYLRIPAPRRASRRRR